MVVVGGVSGDAGVGVVLVFFFFFFFPHSGFISRYKEGVYLRGNENPTKLYLVKAEGFCRSAFLRTKVLT